MGRVVMAGSQPQFVFRLEFGADFVQIRERCRRAHLAARTRPRRLGRDDEIAAVQLWTVEP